MYLTIQNTQSLTTTHFIPDMLNIASTTLAIVFIVGILFFFFFTNLIDILKVNLLPIKAVLSLSEFEGDI